MLYLDRSSTAQGLMHIRTAMSRYENSENYSVSLVQDLRQAQFPFPSLYAVNEVVYLVIPGQSQPAGPYTVAAIMGSRQYKIKRVDNGQQHPTTVAEDRLVVRAT